MNRNLMLLLVPMVALGCSSGSRLKGETVAVSGAVTQAGKPVKDLVVAFQPLADGHLTTLPVSRDGSFSGNMVTGQYAYYVVPTSQASSLQTLKRIDPKYHQADMTRTITVSGAEAIEVALD